MPKSSRAMIGPARRRKAFIDVQELDLRAARFFQFFRLFRYGHVLRHTTVSIQLRLHCVKDLPGLRPADIRLTGCPPA